MTGENWTALGREVKSRRESMGLTQGQLYGRGGPSVATLVALESGKQPSFKPRTLARLEEVLGWERGSVARVLAGGEPTPITERRQTEREHPDLAELLANEPTLTPDAREHIVRQFRLLQRLSELEVTPEFARQVDQQAIRDSQELTPAQKAAALEAEAEARTTAQEPKGRRRGRRSG